MMTRREVLQVTALTAAGIAAQSVLSSAAQTTSAAAAGSGPFKLPPLPYAYDALEPLIDVQTMMLHHDKHHAAYVQNLNKAVAGVGMIEGKTIEEILSNIGLVPEVVRTAIRNHGGGHYNHTLYWQVMKKEGGQPKGELAKALDKSFGNLDGFWEKFAALATTHFGSGWAWLTLNATKELGVEATPNQDCPLSSGRQPLLLIDVWEHAYYLKYQNRRAEHIAAFKNLINWDFVSERYADLIAH
jgi:Fe-Mn family superoxide dismutase